MSLGPTSTIEELFEEIMPGNGMRVVPISVAAPEGKANLMIAISGSNEEATVLMANLMSYVDEMAQVAAQHEADQKVLGTDGKPIEDEPSIIVP